MAKEFSLLARPEIFLLMNILSIQHKVFFVFHVYLLILREREEESAGRGGGRERERERKYQANSALSVQSPLWGSNS